MALSLYQYSQLFSIVETLTLGIALLLMGNAKVKHHSHLRKVKLSIAIVLLIVGVSTAIQLALQTNKAAPEIDTALNISALYLSTLFIENALLPLAANSGAGRARSMMTLTLFVVCMALVWISAALDNEVAEIVRFVSLSLYLFELVRVSIIFTYNYQNLSKQDTPAGSDAETWASTIKIVTRCIVLLMICATAYALVVMWLGQCKAYFNFAMLATWGYLFVALVNLIIDYQPGTEEAHAEATQAAPTAIEPTLGDLDEKVKRWIASKAYCQHGVTMIKVAEQFSTNRTYLSQHINNHYGCNFNTWLTRLRIEEAKRLLVSSPTLSLDKIANQVGFSSKSHFMSAFKGQEHITPGQWRSEHF